VTENIPGVTWAKTDYSDKELLTSILAAVNTVLSFVGGSQDPGSAIQKNLMTPQSQLACNDLLQASGRGEFYHSEKNRTATRRK
jgi:hypothetical protein